MKWTKKDITRLTKLWKKGDKLKMIAVKMGRTTPSIVSKVADLQRKGELPYRHKDGGKGKADDTGTVILKRTHLLGQKMHPDQRKWVNNPAKDWDKLSEYVEKQRPTLGHTTIRIMDVCDEIKAFLVAKNQAYGDSALQPIRIFSKSDASEQLKVRIDDKLNRLMQGNDSIEADEDVVKDLIGYLVLLLIQMKEE